MPTLSIAEFRARLQEGEVSDCQLAPKETLPIRLMSNVLFSQVAFNSPILSGGIFGRRTLVGCRFENCDLDGISGRKVDFIDCYFRDTIISKKFHSSFDRVKFRRCGFSECSVTNLVVFSSAFADTSFSQVKMSRMMLKCCKLDGVRFSGNFRGLSLLECDLNMVDFGEALLMDSVVSGCKELSVKYPRSPECFRIEVSIFEEVTSSLKRLLSPQGFDVYSSISSTLSLSRGPIFIDKETFSDLSASDNACVLRELFDKSTPLDET